MKSKQLILSLALAALFVSVASSCPVCYGETDAHTASAVNSAIISLLIVVGTVLSFFASMFLHWRKRMKLSQAGDEPQV